AARALGSLGTVAAAAVPDLIAALDDPLTVEAAIGALGHMQEAAAPAIPNLIALLDNRELRFSVVMTLEQLGPVAGTALPKLRELQAEESHSYRKSWYDDAINAIEGRPEQEP